MKIEIIKCIHLDLHIYIFTYMYVDIYVYTFIHINIFVTWLMAESASLGASLVDVILIEFRETGLQGIQIIDGGALLRSNIFRNRY